MRFRQVVFVLGVVFSFAVGATAQEEALSDTLKAIAFSPDGKLLVSGSSNKTVSLWDFETGALLHKLEGHTEPINTVGFSADSKLIVSGADDELAMVWDVNTGENLHTLTGHLHRVKIWDAVTFAELRSFSGHGGLGLINDIDVSPDSKYIASSATDLNIIIWDPTTGEQVDKYQDLFFGEISSDDPIANLAAQIATALPSVFTLLFSPDGRFVLSVGNDGF